MPKKNDSEELNLRSEEVQEILTNPPSWLVRWGISLIFMFTLVLMVLAFMIRYPDSVAAKIIVTTEQPTERVIARYSGALEKIYIQNKDTVLPGSPLAAIRNTASIEDVYTLKKILDTARPNINGLKFPIEITSNLVLGDVETAYINFEKSYVDYELLRNLESYNNQLYGNQNSLVEMKFRLKDQIEQKKIQELEYNLKERDFERYERLYLKGVVSEQEFESKKLEFLQMKKNISTMAISISQMREAIANAGQNLEATKIKRQEDDTRFLTNLSQSYNTLKKAIHDWEHTYVLNSSINGIVSFQEFWGVNQSVNTGEVVFSILPIDTSKLVGKLTIPSQNAGKVTLGQKVFVKLDNFPYTQYGMLTGKVKNIAISPDTEGNYVVYISLPDGTKTSHNKELPFEQELIGSAEIVTEDLSIAERVFYRFKDVFKYL